MSEIQNSIPTKSGVLVLVMGLWVLPIPLAYAGGPMIFNTAGVPYRWNTQNSIPYRTDLGNLGSLSNATATNLVDMVFQRWAAVSTATLSFTRVGNIFHPSTQQPTDVNRSNFPIFLSSNSPLGENIVVFDADGKIFDTLFGVNSGILGFAGPTWLEGDNIVEGQVFLNGAYLDGNSSNGEVSQVEFEAVIFHELGHFNNLDHAQINGFKYKAGLAPAPSVETMFPVLLTVEQRFPAKDDEVALSSLYPTSSFTSTTGTITGTIFNLTPGGKMAFTGANVIARNVADPWNDAVSQVSGATKIPAGVYTLSGLTPGASYTVEIQPIDPSFTQGSSVGPLDPPVPLPGPSEFYNGSNESSTDPPDNPKDYTTIQVSAGVVVSGVDILINTGIPQPGLTPTPVPTATSKPPSGATPTPTVTPTPVGTSEPPIPEPTPTPVPTPITPPANPTSTPIAWGSPGDIPLPGDYDGDHKADVAVWQPITGIWYLLMSGNNSPFTQFWGLRGDKPVPGDYDGDKRTDLAVWRPSTGTWYIQNFQGGVRMEVLGRSSDIPVPGDYDGDGIDDIVLFRPSLGGWGIKPSGGGGLLQVQWGLPGDIPVPADYDGDGKIDIAVWRPSNGTWYILLSRGGSEIIAWGLKGDIPVPADYDGDGMTDLGVWRPGDGSWYLLFSKGGYRITPWGQNQDIPVPADYDGDGKADLAYWRPSTGSWFILPSSTGGP